MSKPTDLEEQLDEILKPLSVRKGQSTIKKNVKQDLLDLFQTHTKEVGGETSDGFHTFNELYDYRRAYNAALFNEWAKQGGYDVHKSKRHSDKQLCFGGGWFVVVANLPTGQITNHYELKYWDDFQIPEKYTATEWDGHTPKEALKRLAQLQHPTKEESDDE